MRKLRIVFMGTPDFAVGILDAILGASYEVVGVVTAPDKPAGRGQKVKFSAVKEYALKKDLLIFQPINLKDPEFLEDLKRLEANLQVVVAFRMLPVVVWSMPEYGTFNLHASLLPDYRGAAPINWAIINGEQETGVTTFFIDDKIDTGAMVLHKKTFVDDKENAGILHDRLMNLGKEAVLDTLRLIENNTVDLKPQPDGNSLKPAPKLTKENSRIEWGQSAKVIYNKIRGLSPYPGAWTLIKDGEDEWMVKIYEADIEKGSHNEQSGNIIIDRKTIKIAVPDGFVKLLELQFPGKRKMTAADLLNGFSFSDKARAV